MKKKVISMLLATAMTATVFAGCGSEEDAAPSSGGNTNQEANDGGAGDAGDTEDAQGGEEQGETPADDGETAEIVVGLLSFAPVDSAVQDRIEEAVNEKMLEMINVTADFQWYDASTYATQIPMMIQSGEQLDAIMFTPVPAAGFSSFMSQNQLMDISEYIDAYGADIKAVLGEEGLAATSKEGGIYGVGANLCHYGGEAIVMKKDVLEELDMVEKFENMTTWTELEEILTAAKDAGHPGVINSDAEGSCISPQPYISGSDKLDEAYWVDIAGDGNQQIYIDPADDKVKCYYMNEDYKASLLRAGDWYTKGLIYKDASTTDEYADTMIKNGVGICMVNAQEFGFEGKLQASIGSEAAVKFTGAMVQTATASYTKFGFAVPVTAQEPEAAVKFINLLYSQNEVHDTLAWGVEGTDWVKAEDGSATYPDGVTAETVGYHMNDFLYGDILTITPWEDADLREQQAAKNTEVKASKYIGFSIDNTKVANQVTACQNVTNEYKPMLSSGVYGAETEAKYQEYLTALEGAGINDIIAEYQSQLDAWLATQ
ncbi:MAG: ABC transporter substrate-binding protein [Lachnospiraceae bacterium]|nr:ABC transporter substrate-binding protein [Lachnospiraceae bacterium]MCI9149278.1 ABC transporter substrate-binding protein [Lachnospiraceae bacterium]